MNDDFAELDEAQSQALFDVERYYYCEAQRCHRAGAYLAGCVLIGAALEANLMAMVTFHPIEVAACKKSPRKSGVIAKLIEWKMGDLLNVAHALGWLPADLAFRKEPKCWPIGNHAQALRLLRNYVHPGRYVKDAGSFEFTAETLAASFKVLDGVYLHLRAALSGKCEAKQ